MFVNLKSLNTSNDLTYDLASKIKIEYEFYGMTQDPETKNYMMDTQLSACDVNEALEWIPYDRLDNFAKNEFGKVYRAKWIDGKIKYWNNMIKNCIRYESEDVILRSLNNLENIRTKFTNDEIDIPFGITQDPETDNYMIVLKNEYYSKNIASELMKEINKLYGITQDPETKNYMMALNNKCGFGKVYRANWIDGYITKWDSENQNWERWQYESNNKQTIELQVQIKEAEEINNNSSNSSITSANSFLSYNTHSEAIYTSRLLNYNNLPEPKNSDDYYEQNDNIISREFSESLQLNFSQLNINTYESCQINISQLNINENESSQISTISQLNVNEDSQNSESGSKRKNYFLSQINESESERKKIRIE
ncbi:kinase-like domain-containing protein [Rhizophagus irregularis DAOM 181602=DAOM 197198]|nr:kinase-like domain-containing protein [Rhizophagus irregularis DAOM 181602=DAOM 197198]